MNVLTRCFLAIALLTLSACASGESMLPQVHSAAAASHTGRTVSDTALINP